MSKPTFEAIASIPSGSMTLADAITSAGLAVSDRDIDVRDALDEWTSTENFIELFGQARDHGGVPNEQFVLSFAASDALRSRPEPYVNAEQIIDVFLTAWLEHAMERQRKDADVVDGPQFGLEAVEVGAVAPAEGRPMLVSVLGTFGVLASVIVGIALIYDYVDFAQSEGEWQAIDTTVLGVLVGIMFSGIVLSLCLFARVWWSRWVHVIIYGVGAACSLLLGLMAGSLSLFAAGLLQVGIALLLMTPAVVEEFRRAPTAEFVP